MSQADHSPLAPSSMARTVQCPGSVKMQQRYPEPDGPEAKEGTAAHWVFAEQMVRHPVAGGQIAPNGVVIDDAMIDGAAMLSELALQWPGAVVERPVACRIIHAECWGTPDVRAWLIPRRRLAVADLKYGYGFVDVFGHWQLITYACGLLDEADITGQEEQNVIIDLYIVQPRNYHPSGPVRKWSVLAADLRAYRNIAIAACEDAMSESPTLRAGPECKHCTARHACPTLQAAALDAVDTAGKAVPLDLPTDAAAHEKRRLDWAIEQLQARSSGLEQQLLDAMKRGQHVPFFHVEHGAGREVWSKPASDVIALGQLYGVNLARPPEAITPKQAKALGVNTMGWSSQGVGEAKLVADSPFDAVKIFGAIDSAVNNG